MSPHFNITIVDASSVEQQPQDCQLKPEEVRRTQVVLVANVFGLNIVYFQRQCIRQG